MKSRIAKVLCVIGIFAVVFGYVSLGFADGDDPPTNPGDPEPDLPLGGTLSPTAGTLLEVMIFAFFASVQLLL